MTRYVALAVTRGNVTVQEWLILLLIALRMFTFICMLALGATVWLRAAARRRPAARAVGPYIELVGTVKILIGQEVHSRANGRAVSQRAASNQGEAVGEKALRGLRRHPQLKP